MDPATGMEVRLVRYPAGVANPLHTHPCSHGIYTCSEGRLLTQTGGASERAIIDQTRHKSQTGPEVHPARLADPR
ncbi:MAG: hypothetical protein KJZ78_01755 [Bryobacteraceae bacterium]|nr:hypothetical protein [Bryobacteraceae bacterium]